MGVHAINSAESARDALAGTIRNYRSGLSQYADIRDFESLTDEVETAQKLFGQHDRKLAEWNAPANSRDDAMEALRLAIFELETWHDTGSPLPMVKAALAYFEAKS